MARILMSSAILAIQLLYCVRNNKKDREFFLIIQYSRCVYSIDRDDLPFNFHTQELFIGHLIIGSCNHLPVPARNWKSGKCRTIERSVFRHVHPLKKLQTIQKTESCYCAHTFFNGHLKGGCTCFKNGDQGFFSSGFIRSHK